jgi:hypothetical protein
MLKRSLARGAALVAVLCLTAVAIPSTASAQQPPATRVLLEGLSSPKGVAVSNGDPVVAQGAFGEPGPVILFQRAGSPIKLTGPTNLVDVAVSPRDGTGWGLGPGPRVGHVYLFHRLGDGSVVTVLDVTRYQGYDPDPEDQDDFAEESNPYGLTVLPGGDAVVADAANNDVIRVSPSGDVHTIARFGLELISTDHLPPELGLPPMITAEAVPTTVTVGPDGALYVGELKGFPFRIGTSHVWRLDPDAVGATCTPGVADDDCSVYRDSFTAIQDIAFSPSGRLYVLELAADGVLAFERGFNTGRFPPAVLLGVSADHRAEVAAGELSQPGGIAFNRGGQLFATDGVFGNGRLLQIRT